jgi:hypothetical protein
MNGFERLLLIVVELRGLVTIASEFLGSKMELLDNDEVGRMVDLVDRRRRPRLLGMSLTTNSIGGLVGGGERLSSVRKVFCDHRIHEVGVADHQH